MDRIQQIESMLEASPQDAFLTHALALEYRKRDNLEKSSYYFEQNLRYHPDYIGTYYAYGKLLEAFSLFDQALEVFEKGWALAREIGDTKTMGEIRTAIDLMDDE